MIYHNFLVEGQHPAHKIDDWIVKDQIGRQKYFAYFCGHGLNISRNDIIVFSEEEYSSFSLHFGDFRIYFGQVLSIEYPDKKFPDQFEIASNIRLLSPKEIDNFAKSHKINLYQCYTYKSHKTNLPDYYHEKIPFCRIIENDIPGLLNLQITMNLSDKIKKI